MRIWIHRFFVRMRILEEVVFCWSVLNLWKALIHINLLSWSLKRSKVISHKSWCLSFSLYNINDWPENKSKVLKYMLFLRHFFMHLRDILFQDWKIAVNELFINTSFWKTSNFLKVPKNGTIYILIGRQKKPFNEQTIHQIFQDHFQIRISQFGKFRAKNFLLL